MACLQEMFFNKNNAFLNCLFVCFFKILKSLKSNICIEDIMSNLFTSLFKINLYSCYTGVKTKQKIFFIPKFGILNIIVRYLTSNIGFKKVIISRFLININVM